MVDLAYALVSDDNPRSLLWLPESEVLDTVELRARMLDVHPIVERVAIKGVKLDLIGNQPVFIVDSRIEKTAPGGFHISVPVQPLARVRSTNRLSRDAFLAFQVRRDVPRGRRPPELWESMPGIDSFQCRLVAPKPAELGLRSIMVAGVASRSESPASPIILGPVDLTFEIRFKNVSLVETFTAVVPITDSSAISPNGKAKGTR